MGSAIVGFEWTEADDAGTAKGKFTATARTTAIVDSFHQEPEVGFKAAYQGN